MNYIELLNRLWSSHDEHSFSTTEIALYVYLVHICNSCRWKNLFKRNNKKIEADLGISYNTLKNARNRLSQYGLISFKSQNGNPNVSYTLSNFDEVTNEVDVKVSDEVTNEVVTGKDKLNININKNNTKSKPKGLPKNQTVSIEERKKVFYDECAVYVSKYPKEMIRDFFDYWTEKNTSGIKMRFEMQKVFELSKRLATWAKNDKNYGQSKQSANKTQGGRTYSTRESAADKERSRDNLEELADAILGQHTS